MFSVILVYILLAGIHNCMYPYTFLSLSRLLSRPYFVTTLTNSINFTSLAGSPSLLPVSSSQPSIFDCPYSSLYHSSPSQFSNYHIHIYTVRRLSQARQNPQRAGSSKGVYRKRKYFLKRSRTQEPTERRS